MQYREIRRGSMSASVIGLGAEHLDGKPYETVKDTIHAALDNGINIMDVFMPGDEIRGYIGKAIAGRRDKVLIQGHICSTDVGKQYDISRDLPTVQDYFNRLLKHLGTDYIDIGMLFFIDSEDDFNSVFNTEIADYAVKLKEKGIIRAIGASSHNPLTARKVVETGLVDLLMFSINPAFDMVPPSGDVFSLLEGGANTRQSFEGIRPDRLELYRLCEREDVAITVMKSLGAGKLLSAGHTPFKRPMTAAQCIHYALTRPAVVSALVGCKTPGEVAEAVKYLDMPDSERDYSDIVSGFEGGFEGHCVYCSHCQPCPSDIDIAAVNKYLDIAMLDEQNIPPSIAQHYLALKKHGSDCIQCGSCEARCPFAVPVISNMAKAETLLGK